MSNRPAAIIDPAAEDHPESGPANDDLWAELRGSWPVRGSHVRQLFIAIAIAITGWTVIGLAILNLHEGRWLHAQETRVNTWFESVRTDGNTSLSAWGSGLADTHIIITLAILFATFAVLRWRRWTEALFVLGALATQASVFLVVTLVVDRDRPPVEQLDGSLPTASFPSGHTGAATAFYGSLILVALWHLRRPLIRRSVPILIALAPISVMVARLYRGMHYPTDIAAGFANGVVSVLVITMSLRPLLDLPHERLLGEPWRT